MAEASEPPSTTTTPPYHVVLTGASGYLGQHLLHAFMSSFDESYHIHALYGGNTPGFVEAVQQHATQRTSVDTRRCVVQVEALDLTNEKAVEEWMDKHNSHSLHVCIHAAALSNPRRCQKDAALAHALNVPKAFFDALQSRGCAMIGMSTDQVYAGTHAPYIEDTDETSPVNVYGATKLAMEQYLLQKYQTDVVLLRSSIILGPKAPILPEQAHDTFLHFCASRQGMDTDFYTDERRTVVSVEDVIASIQWFVRDCLQCRSPISPLSSSSSSCATRKTTTTGTGIRMTGVFNMGGPQSVSRLDMAQAVFAHLGYDPVHLIAKEKKMLISSSAKGNSHEQQEQVPSPLDISMDSKKIESITGRTFQSLSYMVQATFPALDNKKTNAA